MAMLSPAVSLMGNMRYPYKFVMISLLFLLPLLWFFFSSLSGLNEDLSFTEKERIGGSYLERIRPLPELVAQHRGKNFASAKGSASLGDQLDQLRSEIDLAFEAALIDDSILYSMDVEGKVRDSQKAWQALKTHTNLSPEQSFDRHTQLIKALHEIIVLTADNSNLILDPVLDTYYLMDSVVARLPKIIEQLGQIRGLVSGMATAGRAQGEQLYKVNGLIQNIGTEMTALDYGMRQASSINSSVRTELLNPTKDTIKDIEAYISFIKANTKQSFLLEDLSAQEVFSQGTQVISKNLNLYDNNLSMMNLLLDERIASYKTQRWIEIMTIVAALSVIVYLYIAFYLSVQRSIKAIVQTSKELMMGNLTSRIDIDTNDETAEIHRSFNQMADNFHEVVKDVNHATQVLGSSVENVAVVADQTSRNVREQTEQTEQVAAAITEMNASSNEIAQNTSQAASAADNAHDQTAQASKLVRNTRQSIDSLSDEIEHAVSVMQRMAKESEGIGRVLDVIKSIAEQTNLLALNAAIEAARAGEQGRGFAVVADEVRSLAQKTHESTQEIHTMIDQLQSASSEAVEVIERGQNRVKHTEQESHETVSSLEKVEQAIATLNQMITGIACAAEEQTATCEEISRNIVTIEDASRDTSQGADQTATAGNQMADEAEKLKSMIGKFTVQ